MSVKETENVSIETQEAKSAKENSTTLRRRQGLGLLVWISFSKSSPLGFDTQPCQDRTQTSEKETRRNSSLHSASQ